MWKSWTIEDAVKEGLRANGWVYRAVTMIARNAASVPWIVKNTETDEWLPDHSLSQLFKNPNPQLSRLDLFILLLYWHQLAGRAFIKTVNVGGRTAELWPISPDRLAPVPSQDAGELIAGYASKNIGGMQGQKIDPDYPVEDIIYLRSIDPANPLDGIAPLEAAAKSVDLDEEMRNWNKAAAQNRGIIDTLITFKQQITPDQHEFATTKIKERISGSENARTPLVLGSDATAQRLGLTPGEMDWRESRKDARDEIWTIYGIPLQLGSAEFSSYNNYQTARRVFWEDTLLPLLDDFADSFNSYFRNQLNSFEVLAYDKSTIEALRDNEDERAKTGKTYWEMGVPVDVINTRLNLGLDEFPKWDESWTGSKAPQESSTTQNTEGNRGFWSLIPIEKRNVETEQARRDALAEGPVHAMYLSLLQAQQTAVLTAINDNENPITVIDSQRDMWETALSTQALGIAVEFAGSVVVGERGRRPSLEIRDAYDDALAAAMAQYLEEEDWITEEINLISDTTKRQILDILENARENEQTVEQIRQAIVDLGVFSTERALMLARTLAGTAASIGQLSGAEVAGADFKIWMNSGFAVRDEHIARGNEKREIDNKFSDQGFGAPRYPLDPLIGAGDRINCRCSMVFE